MIGSNKKPYRGSSHGRAVGEPGGSHAYMLSMIGGGKRVLEFGCASGYMSELLARAGCRVTGVEMDAKAAAEARNFCEEVIVADLDVRPLVDLLPATPFDVAVFGDVLEHLRDPWKVLDDTRAFLGPQGFAVLSVPNIAHGSVRLALLKGEFDYANEGLLDDSHLRFFTLKSLRELCLRTGYRIEAVERTKVPMFEASSSHPNVEADDFDPAVIAAIEADPEHDTLQFVVRAVPLDDDGKLDFAIGRCVEAEAAADALRLKLERQLNPDVNRVVRLEVTLAETQAALAEANERNAALLSDAQKFEISVDQLKRERELLESSLDERDRVATAARAELSNRKKLVVALEHRVSELEEQLEASAAARAAVERSLEATSQAYATHLRDEIERVRVQTAEIDAEIRAIQQSRWWKLKSVLGALAKPLRGRRA